VKISPYGDYDGVILFGTEAERHTNREDSDRRTGVRDRVRIIELKVVKNGDAVKVTNEALEQIVEKARTARLSKRNITRSHNRRPSATHNRIRSEEIYDGYDINFVVDVLSCQYRGTSTTVANMG
jgi:transcriptional/translational regulatory protein YebC/TACO1